MPRNIILILIHSFILTLTLLIASCSGRHYKPYITAEDHYGLNYKYHGYYKVGQPYKINDKFYKPKVHATYSETGIASWYGPGFHGNKTANGSKYDKHTLTAAHRTLPMPCMVRVTNMHNGKHAILMVHDRGPYAKNRIIDVSERASEILGFKETGSAKVKVDYLLHETNMLLTELGIKKVEGSGANKHLADHSIFAKAISLHKYSALNKNRKSGLNSNDSDLTVAKLKNNKNFIQVASFRSYKSAQSAANSIRNVGDVEIIPLSNGDKKIFRVMVGPFVEKQKLDYTLAQVINTGYINAIVVR